MSIRSPYPDPVIPKASLPEFVLAAVERRGDRAAIIDGSNGRSLAGADLAATVRRTAAGLVARGLVAGDVLAICLPNVPEFLVAYLAALSAGGVVTTLNPAIAAPEAAAQLADARARWLVTMPEAGQRLAPVIANSTVEETFLAGDGRAGALASMLPASRGQSSRVAVGADDDAVILYSSGTTGLPKGVVRTHRNVVAGLCSLRRPEPVHEDDIVLAALPMYHIAGMEIVMNHALASGATLVTMPRFDLESFLGIIERHRVTRIVVAPPIVVALAKHPSVDRHDLSSLRVLASGAAPLGGDLARSCARRLGCRVKQGYGMTETATISIAPDDGPDKPESIGPPAPGVECRIVDPVTGADIPQGGAGELLTRSAACMRGYLGNEAATRATVDDAGWLHTGDLVRVDADGWLHVVDRVKELIKYKGYQVAPAELEAILLSHPVVSDAAVVPSPDEEAGEVPKAFVVPRRAIGVDELLSFVARQVTPYKKIRRLEFVDAVPKSPSGKVLRRLLVERERAAARLGRQGAAMSGARTTDSVLAGVAALVTGGGRGLGRITAQALAAAGAAVGVIARTQNELDDTVQSIRRCGGRAMAVSADVTDRGQLADAVAVIRRDLGAIDVLVNNAGVNGPIAPVAEVDPDEWWRAVEINLGGAMRCSALVLGDMVARRRGRIINVTSVAGTYRWPTVSAYAVSKAALVKFTENVAAEVRPYGVSVFSFHPGLLPIGLARHGLESTAPPGSAAARVAEWARRQRDEGRFSDPERAAGYMVALAAGRADALSGRHLTVDDDIDTLLDRLDDVLRLDLHTLRLRQPTDMAPDPV